MRYGNGRVYPEVEPHGHDGEDDGGVDEVGEGDGEDERSGCLQEMGRENLRIGLYQIMSWFIWLRLKVEYFPTFLLVTG